jgi:hypothetical protein
VIGSHCTNLEGPVKISMVFCAATRVARLTCHHPTQFAASFSYDVHNGKPSPKEIAQTIEYLQSVGLTEAQARFLANAVAPSDGWVATEAAAYALGFRPQVLAGRPLIADPRFAC